MTGIPILTNILSGVLMAVEIAWGADLTDTTGASWVWVDESANLRYADVGVQITIGRVDEISLTPPASCSFVLNNNSARYSANNPLSVLWPTVKRNTPVRVRVSLDNGATWVIRFQGYANGFAPSWDSSAREARVTVSAADILRRLGQGTTPLRSPLERKNVADPTVVAYWPLEDTSGTGSSAFPNGSAMSVTGVTFASNSEIPGSDALPVLTATAALSGTVPTHTFTTNWQVDWYGKLPATPPTAAAILMRIATTGSVIAYWDIVLNTSGTAELVGRGPGGATVIDIPGLGGASPLTDRWCHLYFTVKAGEWQYSQVDAIADGTTHRFDIGVFSGTIGDVRGVATPPSAGLAGIAMGHVAVRDVYHTFSDISGAGSVLVAGGYAGEAPIDRLTRLCGEEGVPLVVKNFYSSTIVMGPQRIDTFLNLLRACELTDSGFLYGGLSAGLFYQGISQRYDQATAMTLNAAGADLQYDLTPADNDQRNRNKVTVSRRNGSSATAKDTLGPLGTGANGIGTYDTAFTVDAFDDSGLVDRASWEVHAGTIPGFRYPRINLSMLTNKTLTGRWLARADSSGPVIPGCRIDITNLSSVLLQHPVGTVPLVLEGYSETLDSINWTAQGNCSLNSVYDVHKVNDVLLGRLDVAVDPVTGAAKSSLGAGAAGGATSLTVATAAGSQVFSQAAGDYPSQILVAGVAVTVTAVSGTTSPQTFTVTASTVTKALPNGSDVTLYTPGALRL